ncbi:MAG: zinc ribbon domain-containing protein [bacterium]|nr:zinc ribbon domain-containing protein [bacterium]
MNCQSCGMSMNLDSEHGGNRADNVNCQHCTDDMGNLKSREEVKEGMIAFYMQTLGKTREEAQIAVDAHMTQMPAWSALSQNQPAPVSPSPQPINQLGVEEPILPAQQPEINVQAAPQIPNEPVAVPEVPSVESAISSAPAPNVSETPVQ